MTSKSRPLSPHISVYRWRITSTLSIFHRLSGVAMSAGTLMLVAWLLAAATGVQAYSQFSDFAGSLLGKLMIAGWIFAFFFHLCNGVRHLFWDAGKGFEMSQATASGWAVVGISILASAAVCFALLV